MIDEADSPVDSDARRLALEAIATLANIKKTAAERILRPAGIPDDLIRRFLHERDPNTNEKRSKREAGTIVLAELANRGKEQSTIRAVIELASKWTDFHLAQDEYKARAVVQKARELHGILVEADAREKAALEKRIRDNAAREVKERKSALQQQSGLLLAQLDDAAINADPQQRGYLLEDLLNRFFDLHGIPILRPFRRNSGGEQIDAAFEMDGWHYIVECRWRAKLSDIRELDGLSGLVGRSGHQTMGVFISMNGWSENVVPLLKQNANKRIVLMEGFDLRTVLDRQLDLRALLKAKLSALNVEAEPYFPVSRLLSRS